MPKLVQEVEAFFAKAITDVEAALEADWAELKPAIIALSKTVESQVIVAAEALIQNPTTVGFTEALASVVAQLPADAKIIETAVAGLLATKVSGLMTAAAVATPATPAPTA